MIIPCATIQIRVFDIAILTVFYHIKFSSNIYHALCACTNIKLRPIHDHRCTYGKKYIFFFWKKKEKVVSRCIHEPKHQPRYLTYLNSRRRPSFSRPSMIFYYTHPVQFLALYLAGRDFYSLPMTPFFFFPPKNLQFNLT